MIQIETSPLPNQEFRCVLDYQYCVISLYQKGRRMYLDLTSGDAPIARGQICQFGAKVNQCVNPAFRGSLHFYDFEGRSAPDWRGLNSRWALIYVKAGAPLPGWADA